MSLHSATATIVNNDKSMEMPILVLLFYVFVEYARPAFLTSLRPALVAQILIIWFLIAHKDKVGQILTDRFFGYYLLLLALMLVHVLLAANNYLAYMHFKIVLTYFLVGIALCVFLDTPGKIDFFLTIFVSVLGICALDRLTRLGMFGTSGPMADENDFALAMNVALPVCFFLGRSARGGKRLLLAVAAVLFILGNMVSESRGGLLGMLAAGGYCWLYSQHKLKTLILLLFVAMLAWNFARPEFKAEVTGVGIESADTGTGRERVELWKVGWRAFIDNPVLGVGQGNMPVAMERYQFDARGGSYWNRGLWGRAIHSVYFTILPELGMLGVVLLSLMVRNLLKRVKQQASTAGTDAMTASTDIANLNRGLVGSLFAYAVTGIFLSAFYYPEFWNISALIVALALACRGRKTAAQTRPTKGFKVHTAPIRSPGVRQPGGSSIDWTCRPEGSPPLNLTESSGLTRAVPADQKSIRCEHGSRVEGDQ